MMKIVSVLVLIVAATSAVPYDPVIRKLDDGFRHQFAPGPDGVPRPVDLWMKLSNVRDSARYNPDTQNIYHLFTRENPQISQPIMFGNNERLAATNFDPTKGTVFIVHSWLDNAIADLNTVLVPAILQADDANVIVVDWYAGGGHSNYATAVANVPVSGKAVARFITWLNTASGTDLRRYHLIGHGLGGHQVGVVGRELGGQVPYITSLDPLQAGFLTNDDKFNANDGLYTEVIHTNAGVLGYIASLGRVDFYPNGGVDMPGCIGQECDHHRSFHYLGESIRTGGFRGNRCASFILAMTGSCFLPGNLNMGGLEPKTGSMGIYYVSTRAFPPFSRT